MNLSGQELTITLNPDNAEILHSILEFATRYEDFKDNITGEEIALAKVLSDELNYYITHGVSEKLESEVIDYINDSYK